MARPVEASRPNFETASRGDSRPLQLHRPRLLSRFQLGLLAPTSAVVALIALGVAGCATSSNGSTGAASADAVTARGGLATVEFIAPEKFTDLQLGGQSPESSRPQVLARFRSVLEREARNQLPAGSTLVVRFTEVDQAGWIPPFSLHQVRVISDSRPARLELEYRLQRAPGSDSGSASTGAASDSFQKVSLTSAGLYSSAVRSSSDPLAVELQLLKDWVRTVRK